MKILVINSGSSSIKFQYLDINPEKETVLMKGMIDKIGLKGTEFITSEKKEPVHIKNHEQGIQYILSHIPKKDINAIGHRVVHGGEYYRESVLITKEVMKKIDELSSLAPLHNPPNLEGIKACEKVLSGVPQVAVFDTAFHSTISEKAFMYGIPYEYYEKYKIRKYGFHGTSHRYIMLETKRLLGKQKINMISCHLGNGSSIDAIKEDQSIDVSLGFTPTAGVIMGTRSGDIDPSIVTFLQKKEKLSPEKIDELLNKKSGFLGITGYSDMRTIHEEADKGNKQCLLLLDMLAYDVAAYLGSYITLLGDVDAITFTAGLGENAYYLREKVFDLIKNDKITLDKNKNKNNELIISANFSKVKILVLHTNEEILIARDTKEVTEKIIHP